MKSHAGTSAAPGVTLAVVFTLAMTLLGPGVSAHTGLIKSRWPRGTQIVYNYTASIDQMPSGARGRIDDGAAAWNKLGGTVTFKPGRRVANYSTDECGPAGRNAVHYRRLDGPGNRLGTGQWCFSSTGQIFSMNVTYDAAENWYTGRRTPPAGKVDLWAVTTHEFGHTLGINHFQLNDAVCQNTPVETMCPIYSPPMRDPDPHDIHVFTPVYGGG